MSGSAVVDIIDPNLKDATFRQIVTFAEKAKELDILSNRYKDYLKHDSKKSQEVLELTRALLQKQELDTVPLNPIIKEMDTIARDCLNDYINQTTSFTLWFMLDKPEISDTDQFDAQVIETVLGLLIQYKTFAVEMLEHFELYHNTRGKLFVKYFIYPGVEDIADAIVETDAKQLAEAAQILIDLKDYYIHIHDQIVKNIEKMTKSPKKQKHGRS